MDTFSAIALGVVFYLCLAVYKIVKHLEGIHIHVSQLDTRHEQHLVAQGLDPRELKRKFNDNMELFNNREIDRGLDRIKSS